MNDLKTIAEPGFTNEEIKNYVKENKRDCLTTIQNQRIKVMLMNEYPTYDYEIDGDLEKTCRIFKNDYSLEYTIYNSTHEITIKKNYRIIRKETFNSKPRADFLKNDYDEDKFCFLLNVFQYLLNILDS